MNKRNNSGQVLIEAIVALAVVAFVLAGIVTALIAAVNNSTFAKNQNLATNFAQEGMEFMRDQKETDFNAFSSLGTPVAEYCLGPETTTIAPENNCIEKIEIIFTRKINVDSSGVASCGVGVFVSSVVSWNDSRCDGSDPCHKVELESCFLDLGTSSI